MMRRLVSGLRVMAVTTGRGSCTVSEASALFFIRSVGHQVLTGAPLSPPLRSLPKAE